MAAAQDVEHQRMYLNSPDPSASDNSGISTQIVESQGSSYPLRVDVTVLRAHGVPNIKNGIGVKRPFFVTVASQTTEKKTSKVSTERPTVEWSEDVGAFYVQPSSRLVLRLYAKRFAHRDILIGTHEMKPVKSQTNVPFVLRNGDREAGKSTPPVTLYLTVTVSSMSPSENPLVALHRADEAWGRAVGRIKWVMDTLSPIAELSPFAKMAYDLVLAIPKTLLEQYQLDDNVQTLLEAMHEAFDFVHHEDTLKSIKPKSKQAQILTLMLQDVCGCCDFIQTYAEDPQFWKRTLKNMGGGGDEKKIKDLSATLVDHRRAFLDQATVSTEIAAFQILDDVGIISAKVDDAQLDAKIREIPYRTGSRFTPNKSCLTGTRTAFLDFIVNWVNDPASERSLVLFGQAGTGKSSIAHEIARRFNKMNRLTSSFIFSKEKSKREAFHLITTLARNLSDRYPSFKIALGTVNSSLRVGTHDYDTLFESLILEPLKDLHVVGPILVVIDALDESGDATGIIGLHTFLAENLIRLPSNFRVLITSRPEDGIESAFVRAPSVEIKYMNDIVLAANVHDDILAFLQKKLPSNEFKKYGHALATRAEGVFQWAAVACGYILDPPDFFGLDKQKCIEHLLRLTADRYGQDPLDDLYKQVLKGYLTHTALQPLFCSVVGQLITSIEPLTICSLTTLRKHASDDARDDRDAAVRSLRRLGSLLSNVNSSDENLPIIPLHTSFRDFLTNKEKSGDFCVDLRDAHRQLARSCLRLLLNDLKFNICNLETSYLANKDVTDLNSLVDNHISPALLYACRFWGDHLEHTDFKTDLFVQIQTFFKEKFLFWLEALSLTSGIGLASSALSTLNVWLADSQGLSQSVSQTELEKFRSFVNDASAFVRYFGGAMAKSAPHVYISALPFAPTCSLVSAHYSGPFPRILRVERGRLSHWPLSEMVISNVGGVVNSVAFSPDGRRIVSGSRDRTIRVWNATTGDKVASVLAGHDDWVLSVAFSPDGRRIVSGSDDRTIRVWNVTTGQTEAGPFTGHTYSVESVAFSPDGQRIVSGSRDRTIRVWNATTGETEAGPYTGHTSSVTSVAFSPDGQRIVSASDDGTIRVWNATTGKTEAGPLTGHTDPVESVAFSPDGQRIVSGSDDRTVRVWNATTGEVEGSPFTGHKDSVESVAFSPDGQRIVSSSSDRTIRVWNATTGKIEAGPFTGHTGPVRSVAFSPDGQHILSGSDDGTIREWSATKGETEARPFTGHTPSVRSVAFSRDGQWIVSGSDDGTTRVWNATTGEMEAGPFTGYTSVDSVAFSPDGQRVVSGSDDGAIRVWDATTGETLAGPFFRHTSSVESVAFSPDGRRIVSGSDDGTIYVWNAMTGETTVDTFTGHTSSVESVAFSPDGRRIVSGSDDRTIRVWNATTGEMEAGPFTGHDDWVWSVAYSPDGQRVVSSSYDGTIRVWNATSGETEARPFTGHTSSVESVAFSPDGQHIVSGSSDRTIRVWQATTGETVARPFTGHTSSVESVAFSPDGRRIVSGSDDGTIRVWNATTRNMETTGHVDFTDNSEINEEGWICGSEGQLLMWIPPLHRGHLHRPSNIWVAGEFETRMDLSTFVHGQNWTTCTRS